MKFTNILVTFCTCLVTLQIVYCQLDKPIKFGILTLPTTTNNQYTFSSATSNYHFLSDSSKHSYSYWAAQCQGYENNNGWYPALMNSQDEVDFLREYQRGLANVRSYWIGGSSNSAPFSLIGLSEYRTASTGANGVIVSTWAQGTSYNINNFNLKALSSTHGIYGILCEKGICPECSVNLECLFGQLHNADGCPLCQCDYPGCPDCLANMFCDGTTDGECVCKSGYHLNQDTGSCVKDCPTNCPPLSSCDETTNGQCECFDGYVFNPSLNFCWIALTDEEKMAIGFSKKK